MNKYDLLSVVISLLLLKDEEGSQQSPWRLALLPLCGSSTVAQTVCGLLLI